MMQQENTSPNIALTYEQHIKIERKKFERWHKTHRGIDRNDAWCVWQYAAAERSNKDALDAARWRFTMLALDEDSLAFASMAKAAAKISQAVETEAVVTACVDLAMQLLKA